MAKIMKKSMAKRNNIMANNKMNNGVWSNNVKAMWKWWNNGNNNNEIMKYNERKIINENVMKK